MADDTYYRVVNEVGDKQVRVTVNTFRDIEYFSIREYYMDFDEEWQPSNKGVTMPLTLDNTREMFAALLEILSLAESKELILETFKDLIEQTYV